MRVGVRFSRGGAVKEMTHVEAIRMWEEALAQAGLPIETVEGHLHRRRFTLAAPLPAGYTSDAEWLELHLSEPRPPSEVVDALNRRLPEAVRALETRALFEGEPSLQSQVRFAEYCILTRAGTPVAGLEEAIDAFFARERYPWEEDFAGRQKHFDLRDLVDDLWVEQSEAGNALGMRLDAAATGTGRPDSVLAGLGLGDAAHMHRTRLLFSYMPEALRRWRRIGRFQSERQER